jgi:hypothetical protein
VVSEFLLFLASETLNLEPLAFEPPSGLERLEHLETNSVFRMANVLNGHWLEFIEPLLLSFELRIKTRGTNLFSPWLG